MDQAANRRQTLKSMTLGLAAGAFALTRGDGARAAPTPATLVPSGAKTLIELTERLAKAPRRREYKTVPMILDAKDQWDHEALSEVIAYASPYKQVWDNTEIGGPWLNLMRNSMNAQIWSFEHPDFLATSATHGSAHLALYDDAMWEKYQLGKGTDGKFKTNTLVAEMPGVTGGVDAHEVPDGPFSPKGNRIAALQRRGVPFLACHNAIWELSVRLISGDSNPDHLSIEAMTAELTNHLIPGVVVTPGAVATLVELQHAGFSYGK